MYPLLPQLIERAERYGSWRSTHPEIDYPPLADLVTEQARTFTAHRIGPGCVVLVDDTHCCARLCALLALWSIGAQVVTASDCAPTVAVQLSGARYRLSFGTGAQPHLFGTEVFVRPVGASTPALAEAAPEVGSDEPPRARPWIHVCRGGQRASLPMTACLFVPESRKPLPTMTMGAHR